MSIFTHRAATWVLATGIVPLVFGCSTVNQASERVVSVITPYKVEVVQGNFVSREQVQALQVGMSRQQVRETLGTPLLADMFHANRWDYVFTIKRQGVQTQSRRLVVYFKDDLLERYEGDEMPTEAEFVATIDADSDDLPKPPPLEATPAQLERYANTKPNSDAPAPSTATDGAAADVATAAPARSYPPLEALPR